MKRPEFENSMIVALQFRFHNYGENLQLFNLLYEVKYAPSPIRHGCKFLKDEN